MTGRQVCDQIRKLCPGHGGRPCRLDQSKLSDYEREVRTPGRQHAFCFVRFYGRTAEELELIPALPDEPSPPLTGPADTVRPAEGDQAGTGHAPASHCCRCCPVHPSGGGQAGRWALVFPDFDSLFKNRPAGNGQLPDPAASETGEPLDPPA